MVKRIKKNVNDTRHILKFYNLVKTAGEKYKLRVELHSGPIEKAEQFAYLPASYVEWIKRSPTGAVIGFYTVMMGRLPSRLALAHDNSQSDIALEFLNALDKWTLDIARYEDLVFIEISKGFWYLLNVYFAPT